MALVDELMQGSQKQQVPNQPQQGMPASLTDTLAPLVQSPVEDFLVSMLQVADGHGILDAAFGPETVEDQADIAEAPDPMQFLSREEITMLVSKFMAIPEPQRSQLADQLRQELPPQIAQRLDAVVRFAQGREAQQGIK